MGMKFTKPPLTIEQQAGLLLSRGMTGERSLMVDRLSVVNYYRLSGYWFPLRCPDHSFKPNTTFEKVWKRYTFDRHLRLLVIDAIERIEVAVRTQLADHHSNYHGDPFGYAVNADQTPDLKADERIRFLEDIERETKNSKETFAEHFRNKYGDEHQYMPVWMACEVMTFGCMLTLFRGSPYDIRKKIADIFGVTDEVFRSWLLTLNVVRNICAHHGRLWNREFGVKPKIPRKQSTWHQPVEVANNRIFGVLTICKYCLDRIAPQSRWPKRLEDLLTEYPDVPKISMGFPDDWQNCSIWKPNEK
jgi:abortive infection bacteriophage resistance protein